MAYIETVSPRRASGETREVYRYMAEVGGSGVVAKIVQMFSLRPGSMRRMIRNWELTMWMAEGPRASREMLAATISRLNHCDY